MRLKKMVRDDMKNKAANLTLSSAQKDFNSQVQAVKSSTSDLDRAANTAAMADKKKTKTKNAS